MLARVKNKFYSWRKKLLLKEYFFYKNSCLQYFLWLLFAVFVVAFPVIAFICDNTLYLVAISIATSFFVSFVFYLMTTVIDRNQRDIDALNVLREIARCHIISEHIKIYSKERAKCLCDYHGILNFQDTFCAYFRHFNTPQNICIWGEFYCQTFYKCNSHSEFLRHISFLKRCISIGYSVSSANKPSLVNLLNVINSSIQNLEIMVNDSKLIDIDLLDNIDACHRFLKGEDSTDLLTLFNVVAYQDMKKVASNYKTIYENEIVHTKLSLLPLKRNIMMKTLTSEIFKNHPKDDNSER